MTDIPEPTGIEVICDAVGGIIEFWGFKRVMGRIWMLLYLEPKPLSAAEICQGLKISTGSTSTALHDLQRWGVVRRAVAPGARVALYEAETNFWKMFTKVFRERERHRVSNMADQLRRGSEMMRIEADGLDDAERDQALVQAERTDQLAVLAENMVGMLEEFLETAHVDLGPMLDLLRKPDTAGDGEGQ